MWTVPPFMAAAIPASIPAAPPPTIKTVFMPIPLSNPGRDFLFAFVYYFSTLHEKERKNKRS